MESLQTLKAAEVRAVHGTIDMLNDLDARLIAQRQMFQIQRREIALMKTTEISSERADGV